MPQESKNAVLVYQNRSMELIEKLTDCTWHNNWKLEDVQKIVQNLRNITTGVDINFLDSIVAIFKNSSSIEVNKESVVISPHKMQNPRQIGEYRVIFAEVLEKL